MRNKEDKKDNSRFTMEEVSGMIEDIVDTIPEPIFNKLNGGIVLKEELKENPKGVNHDLFIMGQYHKSRALGRYISIYYGSFMRLYGHLSQARFKKRLEKTIKHELTHHLESLAGDRSLEKDDARFIQNYLRRHKPTDRRSP